MIALDPVGVLWYHPVTIPDIMLALDERGVSRKELGRQIGMSEEWVNYMAAGWRLPELPTLRRFALILGWTYTELGQTILKLPRAPAPRYDYESAFRRAGSVLPRSKVEVRPGSEGTRDHRGDPEALDRSRASADAAGAVQTDGLLPVDSGRGGAGRDVRGPSAPPRRQGS